MRNPLGAPLLTAVLGGSALAGDKPNIVFLIADDLGYGGQQCARAGDRKAIRTGLNPRARSRDAQPAALELYNLAQDPGETSNVARQHPDVVKQLSALMRQQHVKSPLFPGAGR